MSGIVADNTNLRSGQIKAAAGISSRPDDPPVLALNTWTTAANMSLGRYGFAGGGGQNNAIVCGNDPATTSSEEYDGTTWSGGGSMATARKHFTGFGQTGSAFGVASGRDGSNNYLNTAETYNGTAFSTAPGTMATARWMANGGVGTSTAGMVVGGAYPPGSGRLSSCEEFDGTSFSAGGTLAGDGRSEGASTGIQTSAIQVGGEDGPPSPGYQGAAQEYDGTSWSAGATINGTARKGMTSHGASQTAVWMAGGNADVAGPDASDMELYDGTSWSYGAFLLNKRPSVPAGAGTTTAGLISGGYWRTNLTSAEEYTGYSGTIDSVEGTLWYNTTEQKLKISSVGIMTSGTWVTAGNITGPGGTYMYGAGTGTAGLLCGGGGDTDASQSFDGSTWTALANMTNTHATAGGTVSGGVSWGGVTTAQTYTSIYDGSTWSSEGVLANSCWSAGGCGASYQACLTFTGLYANDTYRSTTEEYTGAVWTSGGNVGVGCQRPAGFGIVSAALKTGGMRHPSAGGPYTGNLSYTEEYDGSSWTQGGNLPRTREAPTGFGKVSAGVVTNGGTDAYNIETYLYDGTAWTTGSNSVLERYNGGSGGTFSSGWTAGGGSPTDASQNTTQVWTVPDAAITLG